MGIAPCVGGGGGGGGGGSPGQLQGPPPIEFGSRSVGSTSTPTVMTLTNIGSGTVTVTSVGSSNPAEFSITSNGCAAVAQAATCGIVIAFRPSGPGTRSATITVTSDGIDSPQGFTVTGTGIATANYAGLWWNSPANSESGWGINLAHQGDAVFATWYTYDTGGKAWWLSMLANKVAGSTGTYSGAILLSHGSAFNASPFMPSTSPSTVGNGTLTFTDGNHGSFDYTVNGVHQSKVITRFDLGTGPMPVCTFSATANLTGATNYQDLWWVPNGVESGWGVNFAHQGNSAFATWYTYDIDGTPLWLSVLLQRVATSNVYSGDLLRTAGPRFDSFHTSDMKPVQTVGTASVAFTDGNNATFAYTTNGTGNLPAATQSKQITRFLFAAPAGTVCH